MSNALTTLTSKLAAPPDICSSLFKPCAECECEPCKAEQERFGREYAMQEMLSAPAPYEYMEYLS